MESSLLLEKELQRQVTQLLPTAAPGAKAGFLRESWYCLKGRQSRAHQGTKMRVSDALSAAEIQMIQLHGSCSQDQKEPGVTSLLPIGMHFSYSAVPTTCAPNDSNQTLPTL